jgi:hypothetical protein
MIERIAGIKARRQAPVGWHARRWLATLLISNGENVKAAQSQLYHTTADSTGSPQKVVQIALSSEFPEKLKARSNTLSIAMRGEPVREFRSSRRRLLA